MFLKYVRNMTTRPVYRIVFQDHDIIALSKPANALSTPGREFRAKPLSRAEEWASSIAALCLSKQCDSSVSEMYTNAMEMLKKQAHVVPRQKEKFYSLLERLAKVRNAELKERIWNDLLEKDRELHAVDTTALPDHLYSAADFAREISGGIVHHVHRLDQETSGIILFAKSSVAASEIARQFRDREIEKSYISLVHGLIPEDYPRIIDAPLSADENDKPKQRVDFSEEGKPSQTIVEIISRNDSSYTRRLGYFPTIPSEIPFTMVLLQPQTGRTHQLRVHMLHLGFPMIGDSLYSPHESVTDECGRLCLHAESISFMHPSSNEKITLESIEEYHSR